MKAKLIAVEPHRPLHECDAVHVIAQQYSSATFDLRRSQNREKRLLASSCLSVHPHGAARLRTDGFFNET
jgi:hypothetical protein